MANKVGALFALLGIGFIATKASAKPAPTAWQMVLLLKPPIAQDDTGDAEDAIRNGVSAVFAADGGFVRDYQVSDARDVITTSVEYGSPPKLAAGNKFALPGGTTATVLTSAQTLRTA